MNAEPVKTMPHDIEAIKPHLRKHLRPHKFVVGQSLVTIWGTNVDHARKRYDAMTGNGPAFTNSRSSRKGKK